MPEPIPNIALVRIEAVHDQYATLLRDALRIMERNIPGRVAGLIMQLSQDFEDEQDVEAKFTLHCTLVGITSVMISDLRASQGEAPA